jgi:hypothetical protein
MYGYNGNYYSESHDDSRQRGAAAASAATVLCSAAVATAENSELIKPSGFSLASPCDPYLTQDTL